VNWGIFLCLQVKSFPRRLAQADEATYDSPKSGRVTAVTSFATSDFATRSQFAEVAEHDSQFLPPDNRPLDSSAVSIMKSLVLDTSPQILARHITLFDINLLRIAGHADVGFRLSSGLELITLPQGSYLRQDVIERQVASWNIVVLCCVIQRNVGLCEK